MRKVAGAVITCALSCLIVPAPLYPAAAWPEAVLSGEYRSDIIDYDDKEREFFRERVTINFSSLSSFNYSHVFLKDTGEKRHTWYLSLRDISENLRLIAGNFQAAFGSGLIIGKKNYLSPDPFISSLKVTPESKFMPDGSGNPLFSFRGIALTVPLERENLQCSLNGFYSIRNRYMNDEEMESSYTEVSLNTLNGKTGAAYNRTEPAGILDYGFLGTLRIHDNFSTQLYYINTQLRGPDSRNLLWDYFSYENEQRGVEEYSGGGIFIEYRDDYITLFADYADTVMATRSPETGSGERKGHGLVTGIRFRHPGFAFTATGKATTENFYGLYSSMSPYPERSWTSTTMFRPVKSLALGASLSSDNRLAPGKYQSYLPVTRRENGWIKYRFGKTAGISISGSRVLYTEHDEDLIKHRYNLAAYWKIFRSLKLKADGKYQRDENGPPSGSAGTSAEFIRFDLFRLTLKYRRFFISKNNSLYEKLFQDESSISTGSFIDRSLQTAEGGFRIKYKRNILSTSFQATLLKREVVRKKFRVMGRLIF